MKPALTSLLVALFTCSGGLGLSESPANAADLRLQTDAYNWTSQTLSYLIQVEYRRPLHYGGTGGYGHGGSEGGYGRYAYKWVTVAESDDLQEARFIYGLYKFAEEDGILDEVAPDIGYKWTPIRVRMVTIYRNFEPVLSTR